MPFTPEQEQFITRYLEELGNGEAAVFAGAGLSVDSGIVDWAKLLKPIADELGLQIERERDMVGLAQYYVNERQNRHRLNTLILDEIGGIANPNRKHQLLARLPVDTYWTINYDKLIERALEERGKRVDVRYTLSHLAVSRTRRDAVVYKMHGDVDHPDDTVLIRDDYEKYHLKMEPYVAALIGDLLHKTFLFIGLSFEDPNLHYVLGRIRAQFAGGNREHFCIMRLRQKGENEDEADYQLDVVRQRLFTGDLRRFNITTILVNTYEEVDEILAEIERRYRRRSVLISGSAQNYLPWSPVQVEEFIGRLSSALVTEGFRVITGFGLGIGNYVVTGALTAIYQEKLQIEDHLVMRPFPFVGSTVPFSKEAMEQYRRDLVSLCGIALFIFGNKQNGEVVVHASGVQREFELALEYGILPVPIGATGSVSAVLHDEVMREFTRYFSEEGLRPLFEQLAEPRDSLNTYIEPILRIVKTLRGGN